ncbi:hypothetical protein [Paenibacillus medicaginis]|uniref:Uncharacterized protein n=1 Tax=Paenibacillus medicaginis TaxID=1470560 RepID=A0ABV5C4P2_9BACL
MKKALITASVMTVVAVPTSSAFLPSAANAAVSNGSVVSAQQAGPEVEAASVEYMKRTVFSPDGKIVNAQEEWQDTKASCYKSVFLTPAKDNPDKLITEVSIVNGKQRVSFTKDSNGKITEGGRQTYPQAMKQKSLLAAEKERYTRQEWKNQGKVSENGVAYTKKTRTYTSVGEKFTEVALMNQSGLPVKETIFIIKDGKSTLLFNVNYQYDKLKADNELFNVDAVKLPENIKPKDKTKW